MLESLSGTVAWSGSQTTDSGNAGDHSYMSPSLSNHLSISLTHQAREAIGIGQDGWFLYTRKKFGIGLADAGDMKVQIYMAQLLEDLAKLVYGKIFQNIELNGHRTFYSFDDQGLKQLLAPCSQSHTPTSRNESGCYLIANT